MTNTTLNGKFKYGISEYNIFYYDQYRNMLMDENGYHVFNIYDYITPMIYELFLRTKESEVYFIRPGVFVELVWPDETDDLEYDDYYHDSIHKY